MPRQRRIEYEGAVYHVLSRRDRREAVFLDEADRHDFLKTLAEACQKTGFAVHACCLMKNHFHLDHWGHRAAVAPGEPEEREQQAAPVEEEP